MTDERKTLDGWIRAACADLDITGAIDRDLVLEVARDVAHGVARPAAPLTAYLMGVAVGRGEDPATAAARVRVLVGRWSTESDE
ncbi:MAG TPA: DUF6457 domain-containing protein [Actinocatenispora sp.]